MTNRELKTKIKELLKGSDGVFACIEKECLRLSVSGGVDVESAENNFLLPKILLYAALHNVAWQYKPPSKENLEQAKNLSYF